MTWSIRNKLQDVRSGLDRRDPLEIRMAALELGARAGGNPEIGPLLDLTADFSTVDVLTSASAFLLSIELDRLDALFRE